MMKKEKELKRIAQYLLLHGSTIPDIGLLQGKMGICIFFFHYAKYAQNETYQKYAEDLLDEIYSEIDVNTPVGFKNGLCGIAWGMRYLAENKFVSLNSDTVLKELDQIILERDVRRMSDTSLGTGLRGITYYVLSRCADESSNFSKVNSTYLCDLLSTLKKIKPDGEIIFLITNLEQFMKERVLPKFDLCMKKIMGEIQYSKGKMWEQPRPIGIVDNGVTAIGLKLLNAI